MTDIPKEVGPTGKFPDGKLDEHDGGEINIAVGFDPAVNLVRIEFGKAITALAMKPSDAINLGQTLIRHGQRGQQGIIPSRIIVS